jgi:hypothetical protein
MYPTEKAFRRTTSKVDRKLADKYNMNNLELTLTG